jgi:hypothetical protein
LGKEGSDQASEDDESMHFGAPLNREFQAEESFSMSILLFDRGG